MTTEDTKVEATAAAGKLFTIGQITLATFLGMPLAGYLLLARNYQALGKRGAAWQALAAGTAATGLLLLSAFWLPENFPNAVLPVAYCVGMRQLVLSLQGGALAKHLQAGGRAGSWGIAVAAGLGGLIIMLGLIIGLVLVFNIN